MDTQRHTETGGQTGVPVVDGGLGEEGQVGGELAPEPGGERETGEVMTCSFSVNGTIRLPRLALPVEGAHLTDY